MGAALPGLQHTCPACGTQYPTHASVCPQCGTSYRAARAAREAERPLGDPFTPEKMGMNVGAIPGLVTIAVAVAWFLLVLQRGRISYYAVFLALIGLLGLVKGLATGNLTGRRDPGRDAPARTSRSRRR